VLSEVSTVAGTDHLPYEAVPLVRAVNQMIGKIQQSKQQQEFFLSTTAHELRTPLTILRARVELLNEGETKQQLIEDIRRMTALVNQLLKLMRSGEPQELSQDIDIVQCCKKVISERAPLAIDKGIELSFDCQPEKLMIKGDADLLEIALANLLDNAISFSTPGDEVGITLSAEGILQVKDQGPGIHPSLLPTLFEAFAKYPSNRNGHGLGLAIVKSVTRLHGAELSADNAPAGGAVFTITFHKKYQPTIRGS
jgi:signal transduction histidine kinase